MFREVLILLSCASVAYAWLCAIAAPLVRAVRSIIERPTRAHWHLFATAIGAAIIWSAIVSAVLLLAMMLAPRAGLTLVGSDLAPPGAAAGALAWIGQLAVSTRVPRFGDGFEAATAAAVQAFRGAMRPAAGSASPRPSFARQARAA